MACRPFFGDQQMNARAVAEMWRFGMSFDDSRPMTRVGVAAAVASLLSGEDEAPMRARARELQAEVDEAFQPDGGSMINFRKFVEIVCALMSDARRRLVPGLPPHAKNPRTFRFFPIYDRPPLNSCLGAMPRG
ncbi:anthocyanidin 3-O-glucosyltransferase-like [Panicum miliaceum]|uniref:Anthocyanidin 3-O-glucosyltransferase-like n=1 Tax=Panicum miliaceum TaxID=4540 RepID=A0A3L6Q688_PANMI|nr:anthocyanidin 3-O-glucosyltransferase-like [Panicum miliaceum]